MEEKTNEHIKMLTLLERMDKHLTLDEAENYVLSDSDELMEFMWLKPNVSGLRVDLFIDDGGSYIRHNHNLLLFFRNGYSKTDNVFIPVLITEHPYVLDDETDFKISYDDVFDILDFIQINCNLLRKFGDGEISHNDFINFLKPFNQKMVVENRLTILSEMATLRRDDSGLPFDIWLDEGATYIKHAPRIKFRASNEQRTTREYSSMLITNPPTIENLPDKTPIRKRDLEKLKAFVVNNMEALLRLANGEIDYTTEFLPKLKIKG